MMQTEKQRLVLSLADLEKVFDTVPSNRLLQVLQTKYGLNAEFLETIKWILVDIKARFQTAIIYSELLWE